MKSTLHKLFAFVAMAVIFTSCVSNFKVSSEYDKDADFTQYKTYSLLPYEPGRNVALMKSTESIITTAIKKEMEKRGYTYVENGGDLSVGFSVLVEDKVEIRSDGSVNYNVGFGYYGYYGGYGMGYSTPTTYREYHYNDGTLIIDVFDQKSKNLLWQGIGFDRLEENAHANQEKLPTYIRYIFSKYPVRAK